LGKERILVVEGGGEVGGRDSMRLFLLPKVFEEVRRSVVEGGIEEEEEEEEEEASWFWLLFLPDEEEDLERVDEIEKKKS